MVRHLNHCPDCFDRYIGAARLLDAIKEEEAPALSAADGIEPSIRTSQPEEKSEPQEENPPEPVAGGE